MNDRDQKIDKKKLYKRLSKLSLICAIAVFITVLIISRGEYEPGVTSGWVIVRGVLMIMATVALLNCSAMFKEFYQDYDKKKKYPVKNPKRKHKEEVTHTEIEWY